ncbi:sugar nucleotide-binding protein [Haloarculaceae archaeon H-GB2-1]|nr:sugar nucleotide-binding protein [Haloarculaceae archaeon H-GB11]MEA5406532.1 sugar nucleotide-binding protein [Haloarculaceae archaeon H-GB2-1]
MRVLTLGINGLLGSNVVTSALDQNHEVFGTYHTTVPSFDISMQQLDVTETDRVSEVVRSVDPDWVINCAAMTDVDGCERAPDRASEINAQPMEALSEACSNSSARLLHVSTDYVFGGGQTGPYDELATPDPRQVYGRSKLAGEQIVRKQAQDPLIARLSFVYGIHRHSKSLAGFPAWLMSALDENESVSSIRISTYHRHAPAKLLVRSWSSSMRDSLASFT